MAKTEVRYICQSCGAQFARWQGRCNQCGEWNTLAETVVSARKKSEKRKVQKGITPESLNKISVSDFQRIPTGISEFDRVLGSGIVPGEVVLVGGEPGIGKSTLMLQIADKLAVNSQQSANSIIYISGEESAQQIKMRADRLSIKSANLKFLAETNVESITDTIDIQKPSLVIIDSIQTLYSDEIGSIAGGVAQVQLCGQKLLEVAKKNNIPIFLIGHVTKEGTIAGPRVLEHLVDVVLYLEGERFHNYRLLRSVKNRFGPTDEVGVFEMVENGMSEIKNPSEVLLKERLERSPGSVIMATIEGTRPLLVEIQALASRTVFGYPKRTAGGIDIARLQLIVAVLTKRLRLALGNQDIYVNIVGGFRITEPACDLGVALAIVSAFKNKPIDSTLAVFGEVGLSGELRSVREAGKRIKEAEKLGFKKIILPFYGRQPTKTKSKLLLARTLKDAIQLASLPC
jgi:DNA repair protein RadA/Sms